MFPLRVLLRLGFRRLRRGFGLRVCVQQMNRVCIRSFLTFNTFGDLFRLCPSLFQFSQAVLLPSQENRGAFGLLAVHLGRGGRGGRSLLLLPAELCSQAGIQGQPAGGDAGMATSRARPLLLAVR